ncbi:MAG TPA: hypothetical protein VF821_06235 [Lentzea sp.]
MHRSFLLVATLAAFALSACGSTTAAPGRPVIGPFGYGGLKLGMTLQQALDTKLIGPDQIGIPTSKCTVHDILGTGERVHVSRAKGVATISFTPEMSSNGVGKGATEATLKSKYTNLEPGGENYTYVADAEGNPDAYFAFGVRDGKLWEAFVSLRDQDCHN